VAEEKEVDSAVVVMAAGARAEAEMAAAGRLVAREETEETAAASVAGGGAARPRCPLSRAQKKTLVPTATAPKYLEMSTEKEEMSMVVKLLVVVSSTPTLSSL